MLNDLILSANVDLDKRIEAMDELKSLLALNQNMQEPVTAIVGMDTYKERSTDYHMILVHTSDYTYLWRHHIELGGWIEFICRAERGTEL